MGRRKKVLIYGASYPDVLNLIDDVNAERETWEVVGVIDDITKEKVFFGYPILGGGGELHKSEYRDCEVINNVHARPAARKQVAGIIRAAGKSSATLVHPSVGVRRSGIGEGVMIMAGAHVGARVEIGDHVTVKYHALVSHDGKVGAHTFIGPGALLCGHARVGESVYVGAGAMVRERTVLGDGSFVGMGAVVVGDVAAGTLVAGSPARPLQSAGGQDAS